MKISEIFMSIQGEGFTTGVPALFIRMQGCNLACGGVNGELMKAGKATWWCDSETVWKNGKEYTNEQVEEKIIELGELPYVLDGRTHIIWTGGEPTIPRNANAIISFLDYMREKYPYSNIYSEIETNGSLVVKPELYETYIQQINCSAKLANSGMAKSMRVNVDAINQINSHPNHWYKFVVNLEQDIDAIIEEYIKGCGIHEDRIILMPGCDNVNDLSKTTEFAWRMAQKKHWRVCTRMHILCYNKLTGV
jgi:6-pyruvoyltetrahydropterin 2'-reductase